MAVFMTILGQWWRQGTGWIFHLEMIKPYRCPAGVLFWASCWAAAVLDGRMAVAAVFLPSVGEGNWISTDGSVATGAAILCPSLSLIALEIQMRLRWSFRVDAAGAGARAASRRWGSA
jgi:hypothetical protein